MIQIKLLDAEKNIVEEVQGEKEVNLTLRREYQEGDSLLLKSMEKSDITGCR